MIGLGVGLRVKSKETLNEIDGLGLKSKETLNEIDGLGVKFRSKPGGGGGTIKECLGIILY